MKKVQVLLSSYNGQDYISEQLDSILQQQYENLTILVRDDGSTDGTIDILREYASKYSNIKFYNGKNIGVKASFFDLMKNADETAAYYCFSDQDDIWLNIKIKRAVDILEQMDNNRPLLYCCETTLVNKQLNPIPMKIKKYKKKPCFGNALVENIATGCTCVINQKLIKLICHQLPEFTVMHDWWLYLTASCFGEVYYDEKSYILYRQHGNNQVGIRSNYLDEFIKRFRNFKNNRGQISRQAREFHRLFLCDDRNQRLLQYVVESQTSLKDRFRILVSNKIYRQRKSDNLIFKVLFLMGIL